MDLQRNAFPRLRFGLVWSSYRGHVGSGVGTSYALSGGVVPPVELMEQAEIRTATLPNGLVLLVEPKPDVQSAALSFMVPAGSIYEPGGRAGTAALLCDLI